MRGYAKLRQVTLSANLNDPMAINGTNSRKFMATTFQLLNLKDHELDWVAKHLGHNILVHRQYYRLQEDVVELSKVSKLLLMLDQGKIKDFVGKSLDDIDINGKFLTCILFTSSQIRRVCFLLKVPPKV